MKIYIGNNGTLSRFEIMKRNGWGNVHLANQFKYPKPDINWILDNGAYSCWVNNKPFDDRAFQESLIKLERCISHPDFIICPDIVAAGYDSLKFSLKWLDEIPSGYNVYLAVQNGMETPVIADYLDLFDGLFVGGTLDWKLRTSKDWIELAHSRNKKTHIGKVGTFRRLLWARYIGADSVDSSTFVQAKGNTGFRRIYAMRNQTTLH